MSTITALRLHEASYAPSVEDLRRGLLDVADGLHAQLEQLYAAPSASAAEHVAANLAGAQRAVLRLRERILSEGTGDDQ